MLNFRLNMDLMSRIYIHYYRKICMKLDHRLGEIRLTLLLNSNAISNKKKDYSFN